MACDGASRRSEGGVKPGAFAQRKCERARAGARAAAACRLDAGRIGAKDAAEARRTGATWITDDATALIAAPIGVDGDEDFRAGHDRVRFEVVLDGPAAGSAAAFEIEAVLLHQTLGARWAAELFRWDTPEIARFRRMYEAAERIGTITLNRPDHRNAMTPELLDAFSEAIDEARADRPPGGINGFPGLIAPL